MNEHVRYRINDGVAVIKLHRPDHLNAFTDEMEAGLISAFDRSDADDQVRAVVITGHGDAFCAGLDLALAEDPAETFVEWRRGAGAPDGVTFLVPGQDLPLRRDSGGRVVLRIWESTKPVVAAVNGPAVGVGLTMILPCDRRLAANTAMFRAPFVHRGFVPEGCSTWFLPRLVAMQTALDWMLSGRRIEADEALRTGLVAELHEPDELVDAAITAAVQLSSGAPVSVAATRRMLWSGLTLPHPMDAHRDETWALNLRGVSADAHEGIMAFLERRDPVFVDSVNSELGEITEHLGSEPVFDPEP